jgi:hypothetical protein
MKEEGEEVVGWEREKTGFLILHKEQKPKNLVAELGSNSGRR